MDTSTDFDQALLTTSYNENNILSTLITNSYMYLEITGFVICFVTNIIGNSLTLIATWRFSFLKDKAYVTLQSLTIADLFMSFYILITVLLRYKVLHVTVDIRLFVLSGFAGFFFHNAMLHVLLVAIDRFVAIVFPFFYSSRITKFILVGMSLVTWILAFGITVGYFVMYEKIFQCNFLPYLMESCIYVLMVILLAISHGKIALVARQKRKQIAASQPNNSSETMNPVTNSTKLDRATVMILVIVGVYLLLCLPSISATNILLVTNEFTPTISRMRAFGNVLFSFNSSVNFVIYAVVNRRFRYAYKLLLTCRKYDPAEIAF